MPPEPFYDADGGEWVAGPNGATVTGEFIPLFIDYVKGLPDELKYIDSDTKERSYQHTVFYFWKKYDAWYGWIEQLIQSDLALFSGLEVLRINGAVYQNFNFFTDP